MKKSSKKTTNESDSSTVVEHKILRIPLDQRELEVVLNMYGKAGWAFAGTLGCFTVLSRRCAPLPGRLVVGRRKSGQSDPVVETDPIVDPSIESFRENDDL